MAYFFDSDKFVFEDVVCEDGSSYREPRHYRNLGEKECGLYKAASWSDVVINDVPLDETINFSYEIDYVENILNQPHIGGGQGVTMVTMVNGRENVLLPPNECELSVKVSQRNKWMNRLQKVSLNPTTLPEAKKKRQSTERYPVKPKSKKQVRDEKLYSSADKFQEMIDEKDTKYVEDLVVMIHKKGDYHYFGPNNACRRNKYSPFCIPQHLVYPVVQWDKIWSAMDTFEMGWKREYYYICPGKCSGHDGASIYFYDPKSDDLNYDFDFNNDAITTFNRNMSFPFPYKSNHYD
ncbi:MAG: hypothetical protein O3C01_07750 [Bacteroidetes bacterium]|nr:hypothetical protein [Bacteroidota bacterium]